MGVIRNFGVVNRSHLDEETIYISSDGEETNTPNVENEENIPYNLRKRNQSKRPKKCTKPEPTFMGLGVKGMSHKKFRRYANANLIELQSLVNENEVEELSINDFMLQTTSSFSLLLNNLDQNIDYNDFINCNEDNTNDLYVGDINLEHRSIARDSELDDTEFDFNRSFYRIESKIRKQLLKKHIPLGILASIEANVIQFFKDNPSSMYEAHIPCSYRRLLLHACCQYLNLNCQSLDLDGKRLSYVKNKKKCFLEPVKLLSDHLEIIR